MKISEFKLERFFAQYEFKAPYLLSSSDCESFSIKEILDIDPANRKGFEDHWLGYTESEGDPQLRNAIASLYSSMDLKNIFCFSGAEEAIFVFMNSILQSGDHIIVQFPAYQSLYEIANAIGVNVSLWELHDQENWALDLSFLEDNITSKTRAIIINIPHNPTGMTLNSKDFNRIIDIAKKYDIYIFCDEVYRFLEYDEQDRLPSICDIYEKGIALGVLSKAFGLAGLRIGWVATQNLSILAEMKSFKDYTTICNSAPSEYLARIVLQNKERILTRNLSIINANLELLDAFFEKYSHLFSWHKPKAGSIGFVKILFDQDVESFCIDCVSKVGVLLLPSTLYNFDNKYFRIGFGRKNLPEALQKLEEYIGKYLNN